MWIFDKLFNRKIEGKSSLDDLAENVVVNKETNTTEISGNLDVGGNITKNGQPLGGGTKLYKHHLVIEWTGLSGDLSFTSDNYLLSNRASAYDSIRDLFNDGLQFVSSIYGSSTQKIMFINSPLIEEDLMLGISYSTNNVGVFEHDSMSNYTITDTITEL